jgi:hypothetical protein
LGVLRICFFLLPPGMLLPDLLKVARSSLNTYLVEGVH